MHRITAIFFIAASLSACASVPSKPTNPLATKVEVKAPEPIVTPSETRAKDAMAENAMMEKEAMMKTESMTERKSIMEKDVVMEKDAVMEKVAMNEDDSMTETKTVAAKPSAAPTLLYAAQTKWEMMAFVEAVQKAGLQSALEGASPLTVFAPMTSAFEQAGNKAISAEQLKGHIVAGALSAADLTARAAKGESTLTTITGEDLSIYVSGDSVKIADPSGRLYTVTQADIAAENGMLHMINGVFSGK